MRRFPFRYVLSFVALSAKPFGGRARLPLPFVKGEDQGEGFPRRFNLDQIVSRTLLSSRLIR